MEKKARKLDRRLLMVGISAVALVLISGICLEILLEIPERIHCSRQPQAAIPAMEQLQTEGFSPESGGLSLTEESGSVRIDLSGQYVRQFVVSYDYQALMNFTAEVFLINEYGEVEETDTLVIEEKNPKYLKESWLDIHGKVDHINLYFSRQRLIEPGLSQYSFEEYPLTLTGFRSENRVSFNKYRLLFWWGLFGIAAFLFLGRKILHRHMEWGFLAIAFSMGFIMIMMLPANKVSWDEEYHFYNLMSTAIADDMHLSEAVQKEFFSDMETWQYNQPDNANEQALFHGYLNSVSDYKTGENAVHAVIEKKYFFSYLGEILALKLAMLLNLPLSLLFKVTRLGNLLAYCILMFFAIRKTPVGKAILTIVGLLPTSMYMASTFSYDPTLIGCIALFLALVFEELANPEKPLRMSKLIIMCVIFVAGVSCKAVYAPMLLTLFLLPASKLPDKKKRYWFFGITIAVFVLLMASFILPEVLNPDEVGDIRGGETSDAGQMKYIFGHPFAYAKILITDMIESVPLFFFAKNGLGNLGDRAYAGISWLLPVALCFAVLTDTKGISRIRFNWKHRGIVFVSLFATSALIWTAMYLAFTVPGRTQIQGVQGRYFLPFLFPLGLCLQLPSMENRIKEETYSLLVLGLGAVICYATLYFDIFMVFCR